MPGPKAGFEEGQCSQRWHGSVQKVYYIIITIYQEARQLERAGKPGCPYPRLIQGPERCLHQDRHSVGTVQRSDDGGGGRG